MTIGVAIGEPICLRPPGDQGRPSAHRSGRAPTRGEVISRTTSPSAFAELGLLPESWKRSPGGKSAEYIRARTMTQLRKLAEIERELLEEIGTKFYQLSLNSEHVF